jgi:hypothetical protein
MQGSPYRTPARVSEGTRRERAEPAVEVRVKAEGVEALGWAYLAMVCVNALFISWVVGVIGVAGIAVWFALSSTMLFAVSYHYHHIVEKVRIEGDDLTLFHRGGTTSAVKNAQLGSRVRFTEGRPVSLRLSVSRSLRFDERDWERVLDALD